MELGGFYVCLCFEELHSAWCCTLKQVLESQIEQVPKKGAGAGELDLTSDQLKEPAPN